MRACDKERALLHCEYCDLCGLRKLDGVVWETGIGERRWKWSKAEYLYFVMEQEPCAAVGVR